jgi:LmbE family N-acetylglucosaminyl deacetylase
MKKLLLILAHPDDESLGFGGTIAKYSAEGAQVFLITATRGQRGRFGTQQEKPSPQQVGKVREQELRDAAKILNIEEVVFLDYMDGDLHKTDPGEIISLLATHIRRIRPHIILTFGPDGVYGHPDHIAISQFTSASISKAIDPDFRCNQGPHVVLKLYFLAWSSATINAHEKALKEFSTNVDGTKRMSVSYPDWMITTFIDAKPYWKIVWQAILCHKTQMSIYHNLENLTDHQHQEIWGAQSFYRVFSLVNGGRERETDLFEGIL